MSSKKSEIRQQMLARRIEGLSSEEWVNKSYLIGSYLINDLIMPAGVRSVGLYYPVRNEVDTFPVFDFCQEQGISCLFPRIVSTGEMVFLPVDSREKLVKGSYGIYEPEVGKYQGGGGVSPDVLIVPGVAFDSRNYRVGYGKGYYDRYLALHTPPLSVGYGFAFQVVEKIDAEEWDVKVDLILTEEGWHGDLKNSCAGGLK